MEESKYEQSKNFCKMYLDYLGDDPFPEDTLAVDAFNIFRRCLEYVNGYEAGRQSVYDQAKSKFSMED